MVLLCIGLAVNLQAQDSVTAASQYNDALEKMKAKDYKGALPLIEKAIKIAATEEGQDEEVMKLAKKNGAIATYYVGNDLRKAKQYEKALERFDQGIIYDPDSYLNYVGKAQTLSTKGDKVEAVKAYLLASSVAEKAGMADKAAGYLQRAGKIASVSYSKKKYDEAIACSEIFLASSESANAHYYMAKSLEAKKEYSKALEHATRATELAKGDKSKFIFAKAGLHEALGQTAQAVEDYEKITSGKYSKQAKYKISQLN